jgi:thioredoxin 1
MSKLKVIDFYANWCGPCKVLGPVFESVMVEYPEGNDAEVEMKKDNVDEDGSEASTFGVRSIPTIVYVKDGVEVDRLVGVHSKESIQNKILEHLNN